MRSGDRQNVLIVGSGAREHAFAAQLAVSPHVANVYIAPGNGGTSSVGENVEIESNCFADLAAFANEKRALTLVGPEAPLVAGIRDVFEDQRLPLVGMSRAAAVLEGSKIFSASINHGLSIPQPYFEAFSDLELALAAVNAGRFRRPVIKADGLAAGKGVVLPDSMAEAETTIREMMEDLKFGAAGRAILIQERAEGMEFSLMALVDGTAYQSFPIVQDHKRIGEGDAGANTGGMGAYAPVSAELVSPDVIRQVETQIIERLLAGMAKRGTPIQGILFAGIMATANGPVVIEYNVRGGDPEIPTVLPLMESDLFLHLTAVVNRTLGSSPMRFSDQSAVNIVLASGGYPGSYRTGVQITKLDHVDGVRVFHAGTTRTSDGALVSAGGRVLNVVATGDDLLTAHARALKAATQIEFSNKVFRRDIGFRALRAV